MEGEVDPSKEHKDNDDSIKIGAVVVGDAGILWGKAACGHGAKGMAYGFKQGHAASKEENDLEDRNQ